MAISIGDTTATEGEPGLGSLGALVAKANNGGMDRSSGMVFGPDGNLYVGSLNTNEVLRYDSATGALLGPFVTAGSGGLIGPAVNGLIFRPDGRLYVASRNSDSVLRYDASTGAFIDTFVAAGSGGLLQPKGMIFAPDGSLLVSSGTNEVLRYDGTTGAFLGAFVAAGSGGLSNPRSLAFGPDGNLYVASSNSNSVLRFNGTTGAFLSTFVPENSGGLSFPADLLFSGGSLYVASQNTNQVLRYDAATGAFIEVAVSTGNNGLDRPIGLLLDANNNLLVGSYAEILRYGGPATAAFTVSLNSASTSTVTVVVRHRRRDGLRRQRLHPGLRYARPSLPARRRKNVLVPMSTTRMPNRPRPSPSTCRTPSAPRSLTIKESNWEPTSRRGSGGLSWPEGITFDPSGTYLYVASTGSNQILKYNALTGAYVGVGASAGLVSPKGVKFGPDGLMYVASADNNRILRFTASGTYVDDYVRPAAAA